MFNGTPRPTQFREIVLRFIPTDQIKAFHKFEYILLRRLCLTRESQSREEVRKGIEMLKCRCRPLLYSIAPADCWCRIRPSQPPKHRKQQQAGKELHSGLCRDLPSFTKRCKGTSSQLQKQSGKHLQIPSQDKHSHFGWLCSPSALPPETEFKQQPTASCWLRHCESCLKSPR